MSFKDIQNGYVNLAQNEAECLVVAVMTIVCRI